MADEQLAARLDTAIKASGVPIVGVSIGTYNDKATWKVFPATLQTAAQATINAFNPDDPAHAIAMDRVSAQSAVDAMTVFDKAIILTILDQFNTVRSKLSPPLAAITVAQMIAAIRTKAGEL